MAKKLSIDDYAAKVRKSASNPRVSWIGNAIADDPATFRAAVLRGYQRGASPMVVVAWLEEEYSDGHML